MKTYWDLTRKQRAELSSEEYEHYVDVELMQKGRVRPIHPALKPVPEVSTRTVGMYKVTLNYSADVLFSKLEDAETFLSLNPMVCHSDWSTDSEYFGPLASGSIQPVDIMTKAQFDTKRAELSHAKTIKRENEEALLQYKDADSALSDILEYLVDDHQECLAEQRLVTKMRETKKRYLQLAGDEETADKFLREAYDNYDIEYFLEWDK